MKISVNQDVLDESVIFAYDGSEYRVVKCDGSGNLVAAVTVSGTVEVVQDTASDLKATVDISAGQSVEATQTAFSDLKTMAQQTPRIPPGVTNLSAAYSVSVPSTEFLELLSNDQKSTLAALSGRTVASGKKLCVAWGCCQTGSVTSYVRFFVASDNTYLTFIQDSAPLALYSPSVIFEVTGDGSSVIKVGGRNMTGSSGTLTVSALCWEEDV